MIIDKSLIGPRLDRSVDIDASPGRTSQATRSVQRRGAPTNSWLNAGDEYAQNLISFHCSLLFLWVNGRERDMHVYGRDSQDNRTQESNASTIIQHYVIQVSFSLKARKSLS
jgi:hypothetical protein